jgi:dihydroflavonol-4-reductase
MMSNSGQADPAEAPWSSFTALVLGGSGAIGRHVVDALLRRGARVRVLTRSERPGINLRGLPVELCRGDLAEPASIAPALRGVDVLFHCAAPYPRSHFHRDRQVARAISITQGWLRLARSFVDPQLLRLPAGHLRAMEVEQAQGAALALRHQPERIDELKRSVRSPDLLKEAMAGRLNASLHPPLALVAGVPGLKRVVYVSSVTTVGRPRGNPREVPGANESDRYDRIVDSSPYFAMKEEMEAAVTRAAVEGMPIVIGNPTFCIDTHDALPTSGRLLIALAKGRMRVYLPGVLNVVATRDVGEALVNAASYGRTGQRYILGGENIEARDFFRTAAAIARVRPPSRAVPLAVAAALAWLSEVVNLLSPRTWPFLPLSGVQMIRHSQSLDTRLAHSELRMPRTPIETAIADAFRWFRDNGYL